MNLENIMQTVAALLIIGTVGYFLFYNIRFFAQYRLMKYLGKFFYNDDFKTREALHHEYPFKLDYKINLRSIFIKSLLKDGYLKEMSFRDIGNRLKMDIERIQADINEKMKKNESPTYLYSVLESRIKALEDINESKYTLENYLVEFMPYIENKFSCNVIEGSPYVISKHKFIWGFSFKHHRNFKRIINDEVLNRNYNSVEFVSSNLRESFENDFHNSLSRAATHFAYKYIYSFSKSKRNNLRNYINSSIDFVYPEEAEELFEFSKMDDNDYRIAHFIQRDKEKSKYIYNFEITVNNDYLSSRINTKSSEYFFNEGIVRMINCEDYEIVKYIDQEDNNFISSNFYSFTNGYDAIELSRHINDCLKEFCSSQGDIIHDYIKEKVKKDFKPLDDNCEFQERRVRNKKYKF